MAWLMTWVKGLSWGWTINLFSLHPRTLLSIMMSPWLYAFTETQASLWSSDPVLIRPFLTVRRGLVFVRTTKVGSSALTLQPRFNSFSSVRIVLYEATALASICCGENGWKSHSSKDCKWTAYGLACFWSFPKGVKKVLRELNLHEINGSLLSCLYPLE